jgi:hypothetical protein
MLSRSRSIDTDMDPLLPRDGVPCQQRVEGYLKRVRPESVDVFLRNLPGIERAVGHRLETEGWTARPETGVYQPMPNSVEDLLRIVLDEPLLGAFRIHLCLTAHRVESLRLGVISSDGEHERERSVFLDVERPGALHHELERVALFHDPAIDQFTLELEGTLLPGEELNAVTLRPVDADLRDVPITEDMAIGPQDIEAVQVPAVSRTVTLVADWPSDRVRVPKDQHGVRDAVVFAWFVPELMPELGQYFLNLLRYYHVDSKIFIGMNHGSDPSWEEHIGDSGLDAEIRWARPEVEDYWDATGFLAALEAFAESVEPFELVWFGHTKGGSQADFKDYGKTRFALVRNFWARRDRIEDVFSDSKIGIFAPRFSPLPTGYFGNELPALLRIYRGEHAPIGLHAKETFFVIRDEIVRSFCREVGADFFRTPLGSYGAGRYFFEIGFPNIASMQGFEPFIDPDVCGENHPRDDVWLSFDPKQNHRLASAELERWRQDSIRFEPRAIRELWDPTWP